MKTLHLDLADIVMTSQSDLAWFFFFKDALEERYVLLEGRAVLLWELLHAGRGEAAAYILAALQDLLHSYE